MATLGTVPFDLETADFAVNDQRTVGGLDQIGCENNRTPRLRSKNDNQDSVPHKARKLKESAC